MKRMNIAMLSEQEPQVTEDEPVESELDVLGSQVEDDLLQAQQSQVEVDEISGAVEDADQAAQQLMEEDEAIEQVRQLPKNQQQAALESIQRNVKSILKTVGLHGAPGFAMESANGENGIALEGAGAEIKTFIQKIWGMLKAAWDKMVDVVGGFLKNIFNGAVKLKKRAELLLKASKNFEGRALPADTKYKAPETVKAFMRYKSKPVPAADAAGMLKAQNEINTEILAEVSSEEAFKHYSDFFYTINKKINAEVKGASNDTPEQVDEIIGEFFEPIIATLAKWDGSKRRWVSDREIEIDHKNLTVTVKNSDDYKELTEEHTALDVKIIMYTCATVIEQMSSYGEVDKQVKSIDDFTKALKKAQAEYMTDADEHAWIKRKFVSMAFSKAMKNVMNLVKDSISKVRMFDMQLNKAAIDWAASSLSLYGGKTEK